MEIKNCSIYPRYEESLPKMSRIPEFALFMYHRHGKSNRVKCLPHSNGQALRSCLEASDAEFLSHEALQASGEDGKDDSDEGVLKGWRCLCGSDGGAHMLLVRWLLKKTADIVFRSQGGTPSSS